MTLYNCTIGLEDINFKIFDINKLLQDYMFSLLTGYCDAPAGITLRDGLSYNPYFTGGAIGMPQQLFDDMLEYEDG